MQFSFLYTVAAAPKAYGDVQIYFVASVPRSNTVPIIL